MNWLKLLVNAKLNYWDTCVNVLEQPDCLISDATELQQIVDRGDPLTKEQFLSLVNLSETHKELVNSPDIEFGITDESLAWFYDPNTDIHYFYS